MMMMRGTRGAVGVKRRLTGIPTCAHFRPVYLVNLRLSNRRACCGLMLLDEYQAECFVSGPCFKSCGDVECFLRVNRGRARVCVFSRARACRGSRPRRVSPVTTTTVDCACVRVYMRACRRVIAFYVVQLSDFHRVCRAISACIRSTLANPPPHPRSINFALVGRAQKNKTAAPLATDRTSAL